MLNNEILHEIKNTAWTQAYKYIRGILDILDSGNSPLPTFVLRISFLEKKNAWKLKTRFQRNTNSLEKLTF
jgi:hypothetical protein